MTNTSKPSAITIKKTIGKVKSVKVKKLKFTKKNVSLKISWKKVNKASGYQIQYAENASFKKREKQRRVELKSRLLR